jgi:hypothetical protein
MRARQLTPNLIQLTRLRFVTRFSFARTTASRSSTPLWLAAATRCSTPRRTPAPRFGASRSGHGDALRDPESETVRAIERAHRALC